MMISLKNQEKHQLDIASNIVENIRNSKKNTIRKEKYIKRRSQEIISSQSNSLELIQENSKDNQLVSFHFLAYFQYFIFF